MTDWQDLVARLRAPAYWISGSSEGHEGDNDAPREAAALIERQAREIERLREALDQVLDDMGADGLSVCEDTKSLAHAALQENTDGR